MKRRLAVWLMGLLVWLLLGTVSSAEARQTPDSLEITLQRMYIDGEMSEETLENPGSSWDKFWLMYGDWELVEQTDRQLVLRRLVEDISPLMKANGFFGVTMDGKLSIYNGRPDEDRIIHSFFQIDVGRLESNQQAQLLDGIPILTKEHYQQVIDAYKIYSLPQKKEEK